MTRLFIWVDRLENDAQRLLRANLEQQERCYDIVGHVKVVASAGLVQRKPLQRKDDLIHTARRNVSINYSVKLGATALFTATQGMN